MAICKFCDQEMNEAPGCILNPIKTVDGELNPIKFGDEVDPWHKEYAATVQRFNVAEIAEHSRETITTSDVILRNAHGAEGK